jgi:predicted nuclease of restriction endonuclease-like RecB superfamily
MLEQEIDAAWQRHPVDNWTWEHESELLYIGQSVLTPDFALRHHLNGTVIHVEVVGFWTPEYLADKRLRLQRFLEHPDHDKRHWLLILAEKLKPSAREAIEGLNLPVLEWNKSIPPSKWIETALAGNRDAEFR